MFSYIKISYKKLNSLLKEEAFTEKKALKWLIINSDDRNLSHTIRNIATIWKCYRSKVKRFLLRLKSESLITKRIKFSKLHMILNRNHNTLTSCHNAEYSKQSITNMSIVHLIKDDIKDSLPSSKSIIKINRGQLK